MSKSLKDQLLALGLAPEKKPRSRPEKRPRPPSAAKNRKKENSEISLDQAYKIRVRQERLEKEKAIAAKREMEQQRRQVNQKITALVKTHAVRDPEADCKRNFVYKGRIRSVLATREQIAEINSGGLGVVYLRGNYHLIPAAVVDEIRGFAEDHIPDLAGAGPEGEDEYPVPDDLMW